eukprot:m.43366 g.43366  ORF g.43366 m.43366 type:complete len:379 (-) comp8424_c0_seq2:213-1349(-)
MDRGMERYPLLCLDSTDSYTGYVTLFGEDELIRISRPSDGSWADAVLAVSPTLAAAISEPEALRTCIKRSKCTSVTGVVDELVEYVQRSGAQRQHQHQQVPDNSIAATATIELQTLLVQELDEVGWAPVRSVHLDRATVVLSTSDSRGVVHQLEVTLTAAYPTTAPKVAAALPAPFTPEWPPAHSDGGRLGALLAQFGMELERHQRLWSELALIDERCWVLEPSHPTPKDALRRVVVGSNTSIQLTLDPNYPSMLPECRFLGPEHTVAPLRSKLSYNAVRWDETLSVLDNVEAVLEVECLPPTAQQSVDFSLECGICYSYQLEGAIPERVCEDRRCARAFHSVCLYQYIKGLPEMRQSFGTYFGSCPYCSTPLTVKLP